MDYWLSNSLLQYRSKFYWLFGLTLLLTLLLIVGSAIAGVTLQDISPDNSTLDPSNPNGASGGRVNGLASVAGDNDTFYAASEWGGLYKSTDGGLNWFFLTGHMPMATWDVEVDPSNTNTVYATSFYDGRVNSISGIQVSTDGGSTWAHPNSATPPNTFNCSLNRRTEPSAFGIGIRPDASNNVFIGTNCGVAISTDSGATWTFVDPTPGTTASDVWDVTVQAGGAMGIVDICGDDGHYRSVDGGATWTGGTGGLPGGRCSIAVSPDENYVLFVAASDNNVYESDDTGTTWTSLGNPSPQGRIPFVVTNQRSDDDSGNDIFDLWFSDVNLFSTGCTTPNPPSPGGANRCPNSGSWTNRNSGAHADGGDLVFDSEAANDACPMLYSNDGGVYYQMSGCQNPTWEQPDVTPHAHWLFAMDGANQAGNNAEDLYYGNQDTGSFASTDAGAANPTWFNRDCCDVFDVQADSNRVVYTVCCFSPGRANRLFIRNPGMTGGGEINTYPSTGTLPGFRPIDIIDQFGNTQYVIIDTNGVWFTNDITVNPVVWTQLGAATSPANACGVQAAVSGGTPTFYVQAGICNERTMGNSGDQLWAFTGTGAGSWQRIDNNDGMTGGIGVFGVDPNDPNRIYASNTRSVANGGPQMVFSTDGGTNWENDPELDNMMTGGGVFKYRTERGPGNFTPRFIGYPQPTLVAFDPEDSDIIIAGGRDSGVFISTDGGENWGLLTDPFNSATSGIPHLPRPWFAYFDHEISIFSGSTSRDYSDDSLVSDLNLYIGTQGRGVWRLRIRIPTADANGPYTTNEGVDVVLDAINSSDPDNAPLTYEWDFNDDGVFDDATGPNPTFDLVGQDDVYPVAVKVSAGGVFDIDETTVTVNNVAPTVTLDPSAPADENSPITVSGVVSDPGWLEALTATIDWGDGSPVENISGVLENDRPDATLTFSIDHTYGDNGLFTAEVCGYDDDTVTCENINLQVDNVNPTATIDLSGAILINGIPVILGTAGEPVDFSANSTDPGSDDLILRWDWDDGSPIEETIDRVNPPDPDPFPSPTIEPRDVDVDTSHTFGDACLYQISFWAEDDDGGVSDVDMAYVIIVGTADRARHAGYWQHQYSGNGRIDFEEATLQCYLDITGFVSNVFNEETDASTIPAAHEVLFMGQNGGDARQKLDRQLLTVWLNFANGSMGYLELFDTGRDGVPDTTLADIMAAAEAVRLDPTSSNGELRQQAQLLIRIINQANHD